MTTRKTTTAVAAAALLAAAITGAARPTATAGPAAKCTPAWHLVSTPPLPGNPFPGQAILAGPAVVSPSNVWFPSDYPWFLKYPHAGMLRWNGHSVMTAPEPPSSSLMAKTTYQASFDSSTDGWVVGTLGGFLGQEPTAGYQPSLAHWNGSRWTYTPSAVSPDPQTVRTDVMMLFGVAAVSPASAWAVGGLFGPSPSGALIEHWDGTQWTLVPNPASATGGYLASIKAVSPHDIWAAGRQYNSNGIVPLIEHWDGSRWKVVPAPAGNFPAALYGISGSGAGDAWAVGDQTQPGTANTAVPLIEHWNGATWSVITTLPDIGNAKAISVYAASPTDVWVTTELRFALSAHGLFLHWDGTRWTTVPVPGPKDLERYAYYGVDGTGPDNVWAAGAVSSADGSTLTAVAAHLSCG